MHKANTSTGKAKLKKLKLTAKQSILWAQDVTIKCKEVKRIYIL